MTHHNNTPLNNAEWRAFLFVVLVDANVASEISPAKQQQLFDWISTGYRQKFVVISQNDVFSWALENSKQYDICKEFKNESNDGNPYPPEKVASLLNAFLLNDKKRGLLAKNENTDLEDIDGKKAASKPKKAAKPKSEAARPESAKQAKGKEKPKEKQSSINDEPIDGPDIYYCLKDFDNPSTIIHLINEHQVQLSAIFRVKKNGSTDKKSTNSCWESLETFSKSPLANELWKEIAWHSFQSAEFLFSKDTFEVLAKQIYVILDKLKIYNQQFRAKTAINIPYFKESNSGYLNYWITSKFHKIRVETILAVIMHFVECSSEPSVTEAPQQAKNRKKINVSFIQQLDINQNIINNCDSQTSATLGLEGKLRAIVCNPRLQYFKTILKGQNRSEKLKIESAAFRNELDKLNNLGIQRDHLLTLSEFERHFDHDQNRLIDFLWYEDLNSSLIDQVFSRITDRKSVIKATVSKPQGLLLLSCLSPGPLGCLEHSSQRKIELNSKVSFSVGYSGLPLDKYIEDVSNTKYYDFGSIGFSFIQETKYLYPADETIIQIENDIRKDYHAKVYWNQHTMTFAAAPQSNGCRPKTVCLTFPDDSSIFMENSDNILKLSSKSNALYSFNNDGVYIQYFNLNDKLAPVATMMFKNGNVAHYFANKTIQVLLANGEMRFMELDGSWKGSAKVDSVKNSQEELLKNEGVVEQDYIQSRYLVSGATEYTFVDGTIILKEKNSTTISNLHNRITLEFYSGVVKAEVDGFKIQHLEGKYNISTPYVAVEINEERANIDFNPMKARRNHIDVNWIQGTFIFTDLNGCLFELQEDGSTRVQRQDALDAIVDFQNSECLNTLCSTPTLIVTGNHPSLFGISPDFQSGLYLHRDSSIDHIYIESRLKSSESVSKPFNGCFSLSLTKEIGFEESEYRILNRISPMSENDYQKLKHLCQFIEQELQNFMHKQREIDISESCIGGVKDTKFRFGADKEETESAISLLHFSTKNDNVKKYLPEVVKQNGYWKSEQGIGLIKRLKDFNEYQQNLPKVSAPTTTIVQLPPTVETTAKPRIKVSDTIISLSSFENVRESALIPRLAQLPLSIKANEPLDGSISFLPDITRVKLGKLTVGTPSAVTITVTNVGNMKGRFKITEPRNKAIKMKYANQAVMPDESFQLHVEIDTSTPTVIKEAIEVKSKFETLYIPIRGRIDL